MNLQNIISNIFTVYTTVLSASLFLFPVSVQANNYSPLTVKVIGNGSKLRIRSGKIIKTIEANSLKARVLDSVTCEGKQIKRQNLSGKRFFPKAIKLDRERGNLAVGVLLQDCLGQNISAAFILQPKPNWNSFKIHRVPVPGKRIISDRFSTYPLSDIKEIGFIDGSLLVKSVDSTNSEAILIYSSSQQPIGEYAGCVITQKIGNPDVCPSFK